MFMAELELIQGRDVDKLFSAILDFFTVNKDLGSQVSQSYIDGYVFYKEDSIRLLDLFNIHTSKLHS